MFSAIKLLIIFVPMELVWIAEKIILKIKIVEFNRIQSRIVTKKVLMILVPMQLVWIAAS